MMTPDEIIAVLQAFKARKKIQWREAGGSVWMKCAFDPIWDFSNHEYRIAPGPLECWVNVYTHKQYSAWETKEEAEKGADPSAIRLAIHMREVIE